MRVISWNMGSAYGSTYKKSNSRTWHQLMAWQPDLALVQETLLPTDIDSARFVFTPYDWCAGRNEQIGTLVYSAMAPLRQVPLDTRFHGLLDGQVTVAEIGLAPVPMLVASIHAHTKAVALDQLDGQDLAGVGGSHTDKVYPIDLILDDLKSVTQRRRFIVGGDLNLSIRFDDLYPKSSEYYGNIEWFGKARDAGWCNAHRKFHTGDQRTLFRSDRPDEHFQLDHLFTDATTWSTLAACDVLPVPFLSELTDHAPVLLETTGDDGGMG